MSHMGFGQLAVTNVQTPGKTCIGLQAFIEENVQRIGKSRVGAVQRILVERPSRKACGTRCAGCW